MKLHIKEEIGATVRLKFNDNDTSHITDYIKMVRDFLGDNSEVEPALILSTYPHANEQEVYKIRKGIEGVCETIKPAFPISNLGMGGFPW